MPLNRLKLPNISKYRHQEKLTSLINKKTIRYHLNKFMKEYNILPEKPTPLTVVKHVSKALFWTTVYLAFSYLTLVSAFEVIRQYRDDEVKTNMKAVFYNNVSYLPNMTICFKINASELFSNSSSLSLNYMSAWSRFFEETVSPEGIFNVNKRQIYDDEIYLSLLKYLAMIYEAERAWESGLTQISTFHSEESDDWIALKKILVPNIERYNITLKQLKSVFDGKFCNLPMYVEEYDSLLAFIQSGKTECIAGSKISFIGMDTICFRLIGYKSDLKPLGSADETLLFLYDDGKHLMWCQEVTIDLGSESRSTPRRATTRNETDGYYYNSYIDLATVNMDIGVKALYRKLPYVKGDVQCSSDSSREECENKCLRGWIRANCHCSPITFNLTADISSYRNCTVDDYSVCLKKYAENATYLCTNKCVPLCEQWHYDYHSEAVYSSSSFYIEIVSKTFDYVIIEQVFTWRSFDEFIGALGGALGIWLGLDFVIIVEFIVKLVTKLIKKILMRNVNNSEEDKQGESTKIDCREENVENGISSTFEIGRRVVGHQRKCKDNESEIGGTRIRQINESEEQRTSRKKRESNIMKEKHVQQREKRSNNYRVHNTLADNNMKNTDVHNGRLQNQKVNITDHVDAVQDESTAHANYSSARNKFLQKLLLVFSNNEASKNKLALFLRLAEKLFWAAIYLVGSIFTTLWCVQLINLYLEDESIYFPSLVSNRAVSLPPPSLCIPYQSTPFFRRQGNISNALMDYFSQSNNTRASFIQISDGKNWSEPLVYIGLVYFRILSRSEISYPNSNFISNYERQPEYYEAEVLDIQLNDIHKSINDILLPKLLEWNVTANELRQKLGAELARMIELKITFTNRSEMTDIVNKTAFYTAAITSESFCYSLPYAVNFIDQDDTLEFSIKETSYPELFRSSTGYVTFSDYLLEPRSEESAFLLRFRPPVYDLDNYYFRSGDVQKVLISFDGLYTSRPEAKGVKNCSPYTTKSYCYAQCRIKLIEKLCNCSPTYWTMMIRPTSGLDECTFDRYMVCLKINASDELDCRDSCLPFCTARYTQTNSTYDTLSQNYADIAGIKFNVEKRIYLAIEEQRSFEFSDMLVKLGVSCVIKLGGTLGILLGFSIFSFYQAFITVATLYFASILKRKRFAKSPMLLKYWDKIKESGIAQLISYLNRQLLAMNICTTKKNLKTKEIGRNILLKIGYLIGLYATVRMSNDLFYSPKTGESKSRVDLMMNTTIKLPSSTICMPLKAAEFLNETGVSYFGSFSDKENVFNKHWPKWLIRWVYEYLIIYDIVERHGNQKVISALLSDHDSSASNQPRSTTNDYNFTSLIELDELIDHFNITIPELKQNLGQNVRDIYKTEAIFVKESDGALNQTVLNIADTTFIGEEEICYKLPLDAVTFSSKSDYIFISLDRRSLPNFRHYWGEDGAVIDLSGLDVSKEQYAFDRSYGLAYYFQFGKSHFAKLDISVIHEAKPVSSGKRHCSESKSMDRCQDECQQKKIERICKCSPATRSRFPSNTKLTQCRLIDYKRCAKFLVSSDADLCELSCVPHCTRISLKYIPSLTKQAPHKNMANLNLTMNSFKYLGIKEVDMYTTNDLLNEFGGILGLWIGLDCLAFVDLFYWLVCRGCHTFRQFL